MKEFTQTELYPRGNCWQTAVACVLGIEPDQLPSQFDSYTEAEREGVKYWDLHYNNPLQAYLRKHHGLAYVEFHQPEEALSQLRIEGYHLITGDTVRTEQYGGIRHVVVAKDGKVVWDPHPSRAGLIGNIRWAVLSPWPKLWRWDDSSLVCVCPACKESSNAG